MNETRRQLARARFLREASMEQSVFVRRLGVAVPTTVVIMLIWTALIVPGGAPWAGVAWFCGLAVLVLGTATLLIGRDRTPSTVRVDHGRGSGG